MKFFPIYLANPLLLVCYTAALWLISTINTKLQGMRLLAWAYSAALAAAVVASFGSPYKHWFLLAYSPTLLLLCFILLHYSFLSFVGRKPRRPWGWIAVLSFGFGMFVYCGMDPSRFLLRSETDAILLGCQTGLSAYVLLRYSERSLRYPMRAMAFVFALFSVRTLARFLWIVHYGNLPEHVQGEVLQLVDFTIYLFLSAFTPLGYLWMATTRLQFELESLSLTDPLTGALNRRAFEQKGNEEVDRSLRYHLPMSVVAMDVDRFKLLNDSRGHAGGDLVLVRIADAMTGLLRSTDYLARLGGDEFVVLLPATGMEGAKDLAERLRERIDSIVVEFEGESIHVHASFGVATMLPDSIDSLDKGCWEALLQRADAALYRAKEGGRNRVVV